MCRICRARLTDTHPYLETIGIHDILEPVAAQRGIVLESAFIHIQKLHASYTGILLTYLVYERNSELLLGNSLEYTVFVVLVIGLLRHTKQRAETLHLIMLRVCCMQVLYCLVPAFFLLRC